ncbi:MAG: hypothetical protein CVU84_05315 [Firmicutes bacterium HGW-Firmicutes-1]|jgi:Ger(x)C family germination protein|nr:MAG: hypothetical protein CVU84_05315 [Firmicutes bacterium HGW-Firmicutes-1]
MKKIIFFMIILTFYFVGCASYEDANLTMFTLVTIIDIDENNKPIVTMELFRSLYSQEKAGEMGARFILEGRGDTISEAISDINQKASYRVNTIHNKMLIFTDKAAKYGIDNFLGMFIRDQEFLLRPYVMIYEGDPKKLMDTKIRQEEFLGLYLEELVRNEFAISIHYPERLFEYANLRTIGAKTDILNIIKMEGEEPSEVVIYEGAVIVEDKMVDKLTKHDMRVYTLTMEEKTNGFITIPNPQMKGKYVSLTLLENKIKTEIKYDGKIENVIHFSKELSFKLSFNETQKIIDLTDQEIRKKLEAEVKKKITEESEALFQEYKNKGIDVFDVQATFMRKYPKESSKDVLGRTKIDIKVEVYIEGSPNTQNFNDN